MVIRYRHVCRHVRAHSASPHRPGSVARPRLAWPSCRSRWVLWPPTLGASTRSSTAALAVVLAVGLMLKPRPRPPPLSLSSPAAATAPTFLPAMLLLDAGGTVVMITAGTKQWCGRLVGQRGTTDRCRHWHRPLATVMTMTTRTELVQQSRTSRGRGRRLRTRRSHRSPAPTHPSHERCPDGSTVAGEPSNHPSADPPPKDSVVRDRAATHHRSDYAVRTGWVSGTSADSACRNHTLQYQRTEND